MKNLLKNLTELVKVKTIVTIIVIIVFAVLALRGDITPDNVMYIVTTVTAFYFGTQHEKKEIKKENDITVSKSEEGDINA